MSDSLEDEDGLNCSICQEELFSSPAVALSTCGHVFHGGCFEQWSLKGKGDCPLCHKVPRPDQLRPVSFEVGRVQPRSLEEVRRLEAASKEERWMLREESAFDLEDQLAMLQRLDLELAKEREESQSLKRDRRELDRPGTDEEMLGIRVELEALAAKNHSLQVGADKEKGRQRDKLTLKPVHKDDEDARNERQKLKIMRLTDRCEQLHGALVSAREQEAESAKNERECLARLQEIEAEIKELRRTESELSRKLSEQQEEGVELFSQGSSSQGGRASARVAEAASPQQLSTPLWAGAASQQRQPTRAAAPPSELGEEDTDLLYGAPPRRAGGAAPSFLARGAKAAALGKPAAVAAVTQISTPNRTQSGLRSLFAKRKI